jgi:hypothetical protein
MGFPYAFRFGWLVWALGWSMACPYCFCSCNPFGLVLGCCLVFALSLVGGAPLVRGNLLKGYCVNVRKESFNIYLTIFIFLIYTKLNNSTIFALSIGDNPTIKNKNFNK